MRTHQSSVTLKQVGLRGPINVSRASDVNEGPQEVVAEHIAQAFKDLLAFHEPIEDANDTTEYATTLTITHDLGKDMIAVNEDYAPELRTVDFSIVPDSYQMMSFVVTAWLEQVGALEEAEDEDNTEKSGATPAPTLH